MEGTTNVVVQLTTRDALLDIGKMHDSFDDVITRLIDEHTRDMQSMNKTEFIASIRHIGRVTYQIAAGQPYNEEINGDQRDSLINGVEFMLAHPNITPEENHDNWMEMKITQGWVHGEVKDFEKKTHPDLVPFDELPDIEKRKDIGDGVSHRLAVALWDVLHKE